METGELKACGACGKAKRKCDKQIPSCSRCQAKGIDCVYSAPRPSCVRYVTAEEIQDVMYNTDDQPLPSDLDLDLLASNSMFSPMQSQPQTAWFLNPDTWVVMPLKPTHLEPVCNAVGWRYVERVRGWLADWVTEASNPFIHFRLYQTRLPASIQDAFTALSSYMTRTPATEKMVYRIIEERAESLIGSQKDNNSDCFDHIGRVQALVVYSAIRLFDSDIRQRYLAEQQLPKLYAWSHEMLASTRNAAETGQLLVSSSIDSGPSVDQVLAGEAVPPTKQEELLWHAWILSESVRRTWLVAQNLCAIFLTMQRGFAECPGGLMFTTRRGVWDVPSAFSWTKVCEEQNVGFLQRGYSEVVLDVYTADEVDEFSKALMELDLGIERVERWETKC